MVNDSGNYRFLLPALAVCLGLAALGSWLLGQTGLVGPLMVAFFACLALFSSTSRVMKGFAFTFWVLTFVSASMSYPEAFRSWGGFQLSRLIGPLIQIIMFGMGTTLSLGDFSRVLRIPKPVAIGILLQFTVMPFAAWTIAGMLAFQPEVAAGIILVGSCPGGVASNVMTYLAGGDVALSVTMTACSTLASPVMTPLMMKLLAGQYVSIPVVEMMFSILYMIIVPIVAGLITNRILRQRAVWLHRALPVVSMASICFIIAIITSLSRDQLLTVGFTLIGAVILQNTIGFILGYWGARLAGLDERTARTVSIEVGLQNGGMASGLAINVLRSSDAALAPAIFGPWMNTAGSVLASWWRRKPANGAPPARPAAATSGQRSAVSGQ
jgi:bile acid:Na+ symporter, BASS family